MERTNYKRELIRDHRKDSIITMNENIDFNLEYMENLRKRKEMELNSLIQLRIKANEEFYENIPNKLSNHNTHKIKNTNFDKFEIPKTENIFLKNKNEMMQLNHNFTDPNNFCETYGLNILSPKYENLFSNETFKDNLTINILSLNSSNSKRPLSDATENSSINYGGEKIHHYNDSSNNNPYPNLKLNDKNLIYDGKSVSAPINILNDLHEKNNIQISENYNSNNEYVHTFNNINNFSYNKESENSTNDKNINDNNKAKDENKINNAITDIRNTETSSPEILVSENHNDLKTGEYIINLFRNSRNLENQTSKFYETFSDNFQGYFNNFNENDYNYENKAPLNSLSISHREKLPNMLKEFKIGEHVRLENDFGKNFTYKNENNFKEDNQEIYYVNNKENLKFDSSNKIDNVNNQSGKYVVNFSFNNFENVNKKNSIYQEISSEKMSGEEIKKLKFNEHSINNFENKDSNYMDKSKKDFDNLERDYMLYHKNRIKNLDDLAHYSCKNSQKAKDSEKLSVSNDMDIKTAKFDDVKSNEREKLGFLNQSDTLHSNDNSKEIETKQIIEKDMNTKVLENKNIIKNFYGDSDKINNHGFNFHNKKINKTDFRIQFNKYETKADSLKEDKDLCDSKTKKNIEKKEVYENSFSNSFNNYKKDLELKQKLHINNNFYNLFEKLIVIYNQIYEKNLGFFFSYFIKNLELREEMINNYLCVPLEEPNHLKYTFIKNSKFFEKIKYKILKTKKNKIIKLKADKLRKKCSKKIKCRLFNAFKAFKKHFDQWLNYTRKELQKNLIWRSIDCWKLYINYRKIKAYLQMKKRKKILDSLKKNMYFGRQLNKKAKYLTFILVSRNFYRKSKIFPLLEKNRLYNNKLAKENKNNNLKRKIFNFLKDYYNEINYRKDKHNRKFEKLHKNSEFIKLDISHVTQVINTGEELKKIVKNNIKIV